MKKLFITLLFLVSFQCVFAGNNDKINLQDSLKKIGNTNDVKIKIATTFNIAVYYSYLKGDSAMFYFKQVEKLSKDSKSYDWLSNLYGYMTSVSVLVMGNYPSGLHYAFEGLKYAEKCNELDITTPLTYFYNKDWSHLWIAFSYAYLGNNPKAYEYISKTDFHTDPKKYNEHLIQNNIDLSWRISSLNIRSQFYLYLNDLDKADKFNKFCLGLIDSLPANKKFGYPLVIKADILTRKKEYQTAIDIYKTALPYAERDNYLKDIFEINYDIANNYNLLKKYDSSLYYSNKVVQISKNITFTEGLLKNNLLLYSLYKRNGNTDSALKYIEAAEEVRNNIFNNIKANDAQNMAINEEVKQAELAEQRAKQQKILILTALALVLLAVGVYFNGKRKQKERLRKIEEDRKNGELQAARDLQISMLPKQNPTRPDLDIATFIRSSTEVGGDYYDFFPQPEGTIYSICGDATGHGVTSGMMVSVAKAGLNGIGPIKPNKILQKLNGVVKRIDLGTLRMSMNIAEITNDQVFLSSAAMPPMYLYKAATKQVEEFMNNGLPLGGLRDEEFALETRNFETGDVLIQLSDGLPEAPNSKGDMYDYDQLNNLIQASCHLSSQAIIDTLIQSVDTWMEGKRNPDDITLVVTKKK
jgi:sigma-B regulation protein RsbU (phosphoserine phosphatase)